MEQANPAPEPQYWRIEVYDSNKKVWHIWKDRMTHPDGMLHALRRKGRIARTTLSAVKPQQNNDNQ